ncbi:hypothetical protein NPIL_443911 [Nephila pilipes]|uniref:Uncharacterized protein n=1 Tax=Nephila pilipes TaxID=299642 RepID=A0A8X6MUS9_NEPPI|nr:hypothetical protein NPIL_443911 [Nephila pilipes]
MLLDLSAVTDVFLLLLKCNMKPFIKKEKSSGLVSEESSSQRPKRSTCQKNLGGSNGLLWREETDLKKALYASLQETRRKNLDEDEEEPEEEMKIPPKEPPVNEQDEILKKAKVHAQRKFAQGSNPNSPVPTPHKVPYVNNSATELLPYKRPKTEDFLTFLCLRGTSILPPSLDFLNCCSKSDTSSDCRSLSPELEVKEYSNQKEVIPKSSEPRDRNHTKHENLPNGISRKATACKASSKRQPDSMQPVKKIHSKSHKEASVVRKRKSRDESEGTENIPSTSRSKVTTTRTRSSTFHALREKYKKQRLETNKKKLLPVAKPATAAQSCSTTSLTTRSQSSTKPTEKKTARNVIKNQTKSTNLSLSKSSNPSLTKSASPVLNKIKLSRSDRKLAMEKRKSLRSAHPSKGFGQKRLSQNKKTMLLRRAKLVPPIVDVDSDSEPEIISTASTKKNQTQTVSTKQEKSLNSKRLSERLRSRSDVPKEKSTLTSRQILLRKHMQNRLKAKKSALHVKNIKSRTIVKSAAKQTILKKVARKSLISKTMSLRKDLQNKRVTRSAKHQIEEMLWANPEKRSKLQNSKSIPLSKSERKRSVIDEHSLPKKPRLASLKKEAENKQAKNEKDSKNKSLNSETLKGLKQVSSSKLVKKVADSVMHTRSSKTPPHMEPKPGCSNTETFQSKSKTENANNKVSKLNESKVNKSSKSVDSKLNKSVESKLNKSSENKLNKHLDSKMSKNSDSKVNKVDERMTKFNVTGLNKSSDSKVNKSTENSSNKSIDRINKTSENKLSIEIDKKSFKSDEAKTVSKTNFTALKSEDHCGIAKSSRISETARSGDVASKIEVGDELKPNNREMEALIKDNNLQNNLESKVFANDIRDHKETNVQNNLNMQKRDKNLKKDISELISLNVECEEPTFVMNYEPSCSGIEREACDKKLNLDKNTKFDQLSNESHFIKKHNDKKYFKNTSYKEDKLSKKISERVPKLQNKVFEKNVKTHKKEGFKESEIKDSLKDLDKSIQKKELNKEHENLTCVSNASPNVSKYIASGEGKGTMKHLGEVKGGEKEIQKEFVSNRDKFDSKKLSEKGENGKRSNKIDMKKDSKKLKTENIRSSDAPSTSYNNFKRNCETLSHKINHIIEQKLDSKKNQTFDSFDRNVSEVIDNDTDDDSDCDLTLDQLVKLKSDTHVTKTGYSSSILTSSMEKKVNVDSSLLFNENKDPKIKKESEKDSQKTKKDGESSKHKKDKSSSKDKSCRKEDKSSKKDSEKSLAKLLKRERSKSSKKEEKERMKHKRESSSSSKSSKRDFEKDGSKLSRKEGESNSSDKKTETKTEFSESKKEKSSKKESSKLSRSNSYDETKSPKKKKKHNEFKDIEKIKNLISKSSILNEVSGFKEFKRRLSGDKSEFKKHLSKSKKRKKLALLKEKKLSKKLSSKLLRKYSKKKGLKKKNKLKKKELKKEKLSFGDKGHSKSKKQKHKTKSDHHKKDNQEKFKILDVAPATSPIVRDVLCTTSESLHSLPKPATETHSDEPVNMTIQSSNMCNNAQTCTNDISTSATFVIETASDTNTSVETLATDSSQRVSTDLIFSTNDNYQGLVAGEFSGVFEDPFPTGAILLATRDSISQVPLHFIQDIPPPVPKTMADAATNTSEDDIDENINLISEHIRSEEMSVGTQTITPIGSPSPTVEMRSIVPMTHVESPLAENNKVHFQKQISTMQTVINLDHSVIPSTSQRPTVSNFIHLPPTKPIVPDSVSHILLPVTAGKIQLPPDAHSPVTPTKPNLSSNINVPLPLVTHGTSKVSSNIDISILPTSPKIVNCLNNSTSSVTPEKLNIPVSSISTSPVMTSNRSKMSICSSNPVLPITPAKPKVAVNVNYIVTSKTPSKSKASTSASSLELPTTPKMKKRSTPTKKIKTSPNMSFTKCDPFPLDTARLVAAPVFYPEAHEFNDPLEYISKIRPDAEQYGICKIVPPSSFKPECKVNDDMRFTAHNQYLHKMLYRWGPNVENTACIRKHLKTQKMKLEQAPLMGGIELDISKFYHTVQQFGGLQQVIEKKKWQKVADAMRVPKTAQDRVTKLYDAYCKYLVSYDLLPPEEKQKIEEEVLADHTKRMKLRYSPNESEKEEEEVDDDENYDCVTKGRSMSLSNFFRIARNTMSMWFKNEPSPEEVEHEFWKIVTERQQHVVVHAGNIDSSVTQSGFPTNRSPFAKHPWNLKVLTNNSRSILRSMGPLSGITIPTLHVGMLYTTGCWYRDPHSFPWIEYLHTGASKIWYGIPTNGCEKFRNAMKRIVPEYCTNKPLWLSSDTAMVPPELLVEHGASLSRTIQNSGQFVVIFPESFTSTICCGYCVSESVYFAPTMWLDLAVKAFQDIKNSCESPAFSLERLLFSIGNDPKPSLKTYLKTLEKILPMIENIRRHELNLRSQLNELGLKQFERLPLVEVREKKKKSKNIEEETEQECEICHTPCYVSMVLYPGEESIYCLPHAIEHIPKKNLKSCKLKYTYNENDLNELVKKITDLVSQLPNHNAKKKTPKKKILPIMEK